MNYRIRHIENDNLYVVEIKELWYWREGDCAYPTREEAIRAVEKLKNPKPDSIVWTG